MVIKGSCLSAFLPAPSLSPSSLHPVFSLFEDREMDFPWI